MTHIGPDFGRVRIGTGGDKPAKMDTADYVLSKFSKEEQNLVPKITKEVISIVTEYVFSGQLPHDTRSILD
jgi:peptidyl-tRNA hydrolase